MSVNEIMGGDGKISNKFLPLNEKNALFPYLNKDMKVFGAFSGGTAISYIPIPQNLRQYSVYFSNIFFVNMTTPLTLADDIYIQVFQTDISDVTTSVGYLPMTFYSATNTTPAYYYIYNAPFINQGAYNQANIVYFQVQFYKGDPVNQANTVFATGTDKCAILGSEPKLSLTEDTIQYADGFQYDVVFNPTITI